MTLRDYIEDCIINGASQEDAQALHASKELRDERINALSNAELIDYMDDWRSGTHG